MLDSRMGKLKCRNAIFERRFLTGSANEGYVVILPLTRPVMEFKAVPQNTIPE